MEKHSKKELREQYKNRVVIGGVYCIKCKDNGKIWIRPTKDIKGSKNRFEFSVSINSSPENCMLKEWRHYGAKAFSFEVLEEIKKKETQTEEEFSEDVDVLLEMWLEKQE